ncbi:MAG: hypothetical protein PVSMB4_08090 [Ktedonobacterales bacterium]
MATPSDRPEQPQPRDVAYWAQLATTLTVTEVPPGAINLNVEGRRMAGPLQGFGPLWQKTYRVRLSGAAVTPADVVRVWKERFPQLQPPQNRFYPAVAGVQPGEIVLLNASMAGIPVDAGVVVVYADDESFTLMTPEGLPEAGWITCSASVEDACTVAQIQTIGRANDPIYEIGFRLAGAAEQEKIWTYVLASLAAHFGINGQVQMQKTCVDSRIQWSQAGNVWRNAALRSMLYLATHPARLFRASGGR